MSFREIAPQLPDDGTLDVLPRVCVDDDQALCQKVNGRRLMLVVDDGRVRGLNKWGRPTDVPPAVAAAAGRLHGGWVFDGELLDGALILFDMPRAHTQVSTATTYQVRRHVLESVHDQWNPGPAVQLLPVAWTMEQKALLAKRLLLSKAEGCISNLLQAPYLPGAVNPHLRRFKYTKTIDCVVIDVHRNGKANMAVGCYKPGKPEPVEVAEVTALNGDGPLIVAQHQLWRDGKAPRPVVEISYLFASAKNRLVQPTRPLLRDDRAPEECTIDQLQHDSKELLNV